MRICYPEEIEKLKEIYEPYEEGCHLVENAPQEAIDAKEKVMKWLDEVQGDWQ